MHQIQSTAYLTTLATTKSHPAPTMDEIASVASPETEEANMEDL